VGASGSLEDRALALDALAGVPEQAAAAELRALLAAMTDVMLILDAEGRCLWIAPTSTDRLYRPAEEQVGKTLHDVLPRGVADGYLATIHRAIEFRRPEQLEYRLEIHGRTTWFEGTASPMDGDRVLWVARDVTARRIGEAAHAATYRIAGAASTSAGLQDLLRAIHGIIGDLMPAKNLYIALRDPATGLVSFPYFVDEQDPGPPAPHVPGRSLTAYVMRTGEPLLASADVFRAMVARGDVDEIGAPSIDWMGVPLRVADRVIGVLAVQTYAEGVRYGASDLRILQFVSTQIGLAIERTRAQESLRRERDVSESIIASLPGIFYLFDADGRFQRWNTAFERATGRSAREIPEITALDVIAPEDREAVGRRIRDVLEHGDANVEADLIAKDGTRTPYFFTGNRILLDGQACVVGMGLDVTEQRRLELQFQQAQKMEAVGRLAGGIAHDFNNLLTAVLAHTDFLLADRAIDEAGHEEVREIREAANRAAALTQQLLAFSRRQVLQLRVVDLNRVVAEAETMLRRLIGEHIRLVTRPASALWPIRADAGQLQQVIVNLAVNARDAMPQGGVLAIETRNAALAEDIGAAPGTVTPEQSYVPAGDYVLLTVTDTGVGMDAESRHRVFEPFFTTKERGKGTGLGLSMVYGVVKQSGGWVWADSEPGAGTTFSIYLPRAEGAAPDTRPAEPEVSDGAGCTETVLLVEDETAVRTVVRTMLARRGYTVLEAPEAESALRLADGHDGRIHILLTDVVMPGMSGVDLARTLAPQRPGLKVLLMSGHTDDAVIRHGGIAPGAHFLQKPFTPDELQRRIRSILDAE